LLFGFTTAGLSGAIRGRAGKWGLAFLVVMLLILAAGFMLYRCIFVPVDMEAEEENVLVDIESGTTTGDIGVKLEDKNLIRSAFIFTQYLRLTGMDKDIKAGSYALSPSMDVPEIAGYLAGGEVEDLDTIVFTIPEGWNIEQMAGHLDEQRLVDKERFLELVYSPAPELIDDYPFLEGEISSREYYLEGYLFPKTYEVDAEAAEEDIIRVMLDQMKKVIEEKWEKIEETGMTPEEIITLASIIEKEAVVDQERQVISSVFHNRLEAGMALESCATVNYALGEYKEVLLFQDLETDSPYNTYQKRGLPPGPIASPGRASIRAALNPKDTDYRYFVSRGDGSGKHLFAETYEGHLRNRMEVNQEK